MNVRNTIIPYPQKISESGKLIKLGNVANCNFKISLADESLINAADNIREAFMDKASVYEGDCGYEIKILVNPEASEFEGEIRYEGYIINTSDKCTEIIGYDTKGAYWGTVTFAGALFEEENDIFLPEMNVVDYPYFKKRGHFMECRYGSDFMSLEDWKGAVDILSKAKMNTMILGLYGCWVRQYDGRIAEFQYVPFKKYPELKTPRHIKYYSAKKKSYVFKKDVLPRIYEEDYLSELIAYANKKQVQVVPLFNSLGHNTLIPRMIPEISSIDENGKPRGFGVCTRNEKTYEVMFSIYDEIIDRYLKPNGIDAFEIGMDEVRGMMGLHFDDLFGVTSHICQCDKCRGVEFHELMIEYIINLAKHLVSRGIKDIYIYHDVLFANNLLNEALVERFKSAGVYDNIIIDWWSYTKPENIFNGRGDEVSTLFRSVGKAATGYSHWNLPTQSSDNLIAMSKLAKNKNFEGVIAYGSYEHSFDYNYNLLAETGWNPDRCEIENDTLSRYVAKNFPENPAKGMEIMKLIQEFSNSRYTTSENYLDEKFCYYDYCYLKKDEEYPRDYPAMQYRWIRDDETKYLPYLRNSIAETEYAYNEICKNFFGEKAQIWKLVSLSFNAVADEFYTIYTCAKDYNRGAITIFKFVEELDRLLLKRDKLIELLENVRIEANVYTAARNMSVLRQCVADLKSYIIKSLKKGETPKIDIFNFKQYLSDVSVFFR